jgi:hypothetical protein
VTLFPDPDSPTKATISPGRTSKETPSTTGAPFSAGKATVRFRTERSGSDKAPE